MKVINKQRIVKYLVTFINDIQEIVSNYWYNKIELHLESEYEGLKFIGDASFLELDWVIVVSVKVYQWEKMRFELPLKIKVDCIDLSNLVITRFNSLILLGDVSG